MAIPESASEVYDWILINVYQRDQEMFDWSTKVFEKAKRVGSVNCIPIFWDKICMIQEEQPWFNRWLKLVSWTMDKDISAEEHTHEELLEELWAKCTSLELYKNYKVWWKMEYNKYMYIARWCEIVQEQTLFWWEKIELVYVEFDEFVSRICEEDYHFISFANDVLRMKLENKLDDFKNLLFNW